MRVTKEGLLEYDAAPLNFFTFKPPQGFAGYLEEMAKVLIHPTRGAGISMYWYREGSFDAAGITIANAADKLAPTRGSPILPMIKTQYGRYFTHLAIVPEVLDLRPGSSAFSFGGPLPIPATDQDRDTQGIYLVNDRIPALAKLLKVTEGSYGGVALAHEFMHMIISAFLGGAVWDGEEHLRVAPTNKLMDNDRTKANMDSAKVVVGATTETEIAMNQNPNLYPLPAKIVADNGTLN